MTVPTAAQGMQVPPSPRTQASEKEPLNLVRGAPQAHIQATGEPLVAEAKKKKSERKKNKHAPNSKHQLWAAEFQGGEGYQHS